jgi:hypothetical protein
MGRMREMKVTDTELNWLYSALIAKQPIDPSWFGVLPLYVGHLLKAGDYEES